MFPRATRPQNVSPYFNFCNMKCFECDKPATCKHHVVPRVLGGTKTVPLCDDCHSMAHAKEGASHSALVSIGRNSALPDYVAISECIAILKCRGRMRLSDCAEIFSTSTTKVFRIWNGKARIAKRTRELAKLFSFPLPEPSQYRVRKTKQRLA